MFRSLKELFGYNITALDGDIGKVHDFYFDDDEWKIRYLVVDTGPWIFGRKVLISPKALGKPDWMAQKFPVNLTREQIKNSPDIDTEAPVSRQQQIALHEHFGWSTYWATPLSPSPAGRAIMHSELEAVKEKEVIKTVEVEEAEADSNLRRAQEVIGYRVEGRDNGIKSVDDFILDDENWIIRYLVLDTSNLFEGKKVLISPFWWIKWIRYDEKQVFIDLTKQIIEDSPPFDPTRPINREYEEVLYDYHGRPYYWLKR